MILDTSKNKPFTLPQLKAIRALCTKHGVDVVGLEIVRNEGLTWKGAVACFSVLHPDSIYLCIDQPNICKLVPYIGHEVRHREQYLRGKASYLIMANPLWRRWTIEPEAYAEEERINMELL